MKRAGMVGIPPKHGAVKPLRRRVSLALKQQGLIEGRIARRRLRRRGNFGAFKSVLLKTASFACHASTIVQHNHDGHCWASP